MDHKLMVNNLILK
ncbi:hypothetical protein PCHDK_000522800 [Plasmodium chabaudi adami]|uniref:Uncharacterized protein n=1 Tax=Plasmodium chabaudi adami TaxID=5826 RepID=A0A1D3L9H0_PLACE|nr:hypothetical protein PCHDK_000522800 [Plasmodium chabaudi adami]